MDEPINFLKDEETEHSTKLEELIDLLESTNTKKKSHRLFRRKNEDELIEQRLEEMKILSNNLNRIYNKIDQNYKKYLTQEKEKFSDYVMAGKKLRDIENSLNMYKEKKRELENMIEKLDPFDEKVIDYKIKLQEIEQQIRNGELQRISYTKRVKSTKSIYEFTEKYARVYSSMLTTVSSLLNSVETIIRYIEFSKEMLIPGEELKTTVKQALLKGIEGIQKSNIQLEKMLGDVVKLDEIGKRILLSEDGLKGANEILSKYEQMLNEAQENIEAELNKELKELGIIAEEEKEQENIIEMNDEK